MWVWKKQAKKVGEMEVDDAGMKQPEEWMLKWVREMGEGWQETAVGRWLENWKAGRQADG